MSDSKPELREGETVIGEYGAFVYRSDGHISSIGDPLQLWLTDQQVILKKSPWAPQRTLPLCAITDIREQVVTRVKMVRIEFANGHVEWLSTFQNQSQFLDALRAAQAHAPQISEMTSSGPGTPAGPVVPRTSPLIWIAILFLMAMLACTLVTVGLVVVALTYLGPTR